MVKNEGLGEPRCETVPLMGLRALLWETGIFVGYPMDADTGHPWSLVITGQFLMRPALLVLGLQASLSPEAWP